MNATSKAMRLLAALLALALLAVACADDGTDDPGDSQAGETDGAGTEAPDDAATDGSPDTGQGATDDPGSEEPWAGVEPGPMEVVLWQPEGTRRYEIDLEVSAALEERIPGVEIEHTDFGGAAGTEAQQARWRAGDPPEVTPGFFSGATYGPDTRWADEGLVHDLTDVMQQDLAGYDSSWVDAMLPAVVDFVTHSDGTIYAVPSEVTTLQFFYNRSLFDDLGLEAPETWDELLEVAEALDAEGVTPFAVTGTFPFYMQMYFDYLIMRHGGAEAALEVIAGNGDFADVPNVDQAAAELERIVGNGWFIDGFEGTDFTAAQIAFFQGDAAMILMGSWLIGEMADSIPEGFDVGTFPFPRVESIEEGQTDVFGAVNNIVVAAESARPDLGVEWLRTFSEKEHQERRVTELQGISPYRGVGSPEGFGPIVDALNEGGAFIPSYLGLSTAADASIADAYQQPVTRLFFGQIGAEEMVEQIDGAMREAHAGLGN